MSFSTVMSAAIEGLHVELVHVETDISSGLPVFHMVGYLSSEVKEASERVRTAVQNSDIRIPAKKIIINLGPATVRKKGASFDFPIHLILPLLCYIFLKPFFPARDGFHAAFYTAIYDCLHDRVIKICIIF